MDVPAFKYIQKGLAVVLVLVISLAGIHGYLHPDLYRELVSLRMFRITVLFNTNYDGQ